MRHLADEEDSRFFLQHPDRCSHIRMPKQVLETNQQRATFYIGELEREFRTLGPHNKGRRLILLWRVPADNPFYDPHKPQIMKIPFLAFADETIEDSDHVLLPILQQIMAEAYKGA